MDKHYWFYKDNQRFLLLQQKLKNDASDKDKAGELKGLGALAAKQLRGKKANDVEILTSSKIDHNFLGDFIQSFEKTNFEFSLKSHIGASDDFKGEDDDYRKDKHLTRIENYSVSHEKAEFSSNEEYSYKLAAAKATNFARSLAN